MYRDDPLDDEMELRNIVGDEAVDQLLDAPLGDSRQALHAALDVLRVLQGWADDASIRIWLLSPQQRLEGHTPVQRLTSGDFDDVEDAARAWAAARG
ncbi:MAG: hypothetical protein WD360_00600 [Nitriliruptoraceae bacterium]